MVNTTFTRILQLSPQSFQHYQWEQTETSSINTCKIQSIIRKWQLKTLLISSQVKQNPNQLGYIWKMDNSIIYINILVPNKKQNQTKFSNYNYCSEELANTINKIISFLICCIHWTKQARAKFALNQLKCNK